MATIMTSLAELKTAVDNIARNQDLTATVASTIDFSLELATLVPHVRAAIDKLPPQERTVFLLSRRGVGIREIARVLHISVSSAATRLARATYKLREEFGDELFSDSGEGGGG